MTTLAMFMTMMMTTIMMMIDNTPLSPFNQTSLFLVSCSFNLKPKLLSRAPHSPCNPAIPLSANRSPKYPDAPHYPHHHTFPLTRVLYGFNRYSCTNGTPSGQFDSAHMGSCGKPHLAAQASASSVTTHVNVPVKSSQLRQVMRVEMEGT